MKFTKFASLLLLLFIINISNSRTATADINVMASIKPIHSLVSMVMEGVGEPSLLVGGAASPHTFSLKPSQARQIEKADVIFWVSPTLETFLEKPLETIGSSAKTYELIEMTSLKRLSFREGGPFEGHLHDDHDDHKEHAEEGHGKHKEHAEEGHGKHKEHAEEGHGKHKEHAEEGHSDDESDPHVWLDPENAKLMLSYISHELGEIDPANASKYEENAATAKLSIDKVSLSIEKELNPYKGSGFIVFHDAYQYFENRFGLQASGSISVHPDTVPGAQRMSEIRKVLSNPSVKCVFNEPQFETRVINTIIDGTGKKSVQIDPLGASLTPGKRLYLDLMMNMGESFHECFH